MIKITCIHCNAEYSPQRVWGLGGEVTLFVEPCSCVVEQEQDNHDSEMQAWHTRSTNLEKVVSELEDKLEENAKLIEKLKGWLNDINS